MVDCCSNEQMVRHIYCKIKCCIVPIKRNAAATCTCNSNSNNPAGTSIPKMSDFNTTVTATSLAPQTLC